MQSLGEFLRYTRKSKGITQEEMASKICVVSPVISKWENGKSIPDLAALCKLCNILEISLEECIAGCKLDMPLALPPANYDAQRLGERLKDLRIRNNLSQSDIGKELFVTSQTISRWESGEMNSLENLQSICQFYEISIGYLFQEDTIQNFASHVSENYRDEIFSKSIDPQPKPVVPKNYLAKFVFVLSAIIVIVALSVTGGISVYGHTHSLIYFAKVEPSCESTGRISYWQCTECKKCFFYSKGKNPISDISISASGHDFGQWQLLKPATCAQDGEEIRYCANDGAHYEMRVVPMLSHKLTITETGCISSGICELCNMVIRTGQHDYENGKCVNCGKYEYFTPMAPLDEYTLGQIYSEDLVFNPTHNYWAQHEGVDFTAPAGSEVKCIEDGTVKEVTNDSYSGATVTIEHSDGFTSVYKLIDGVSLKVGDKVLKGDIIGKVSDTALEEIADGPHLHLELYKDGVKVNPLDYITT